MADDDQPAPPLLSKTTTVSGGGEPAASTTTTTVPYMGSWKLRRRVIFGTLAYCALHVSYLTFWAGDTVLRQQIAIALTGLAAATVGSYVFGAVYDDRNIRRDGV